MYVGAVSFVSRQYLERCLSECGPFSDPSDIRVTGVHHGYRQFTLKGDHPFRWLCERGWVSWLEPGGFVLPHVDAGPWKRRYQLPIWAQGNLGYLVENGWDWEKAEPGRRFRVSHNKVHAVVNDSDSPRLHVVYEQGDPKGDTTDFRLYGNYLPDRIKVLWESAI